jgi:hypothetical protein
MIERKHINHAELLELGRMLLLLIKRQQATLNFSSPELDRRVTGEKLPSRLLKKLNFACLILV